MTRPATRKPPPWRRNLLILAALGLLLALSCFIAFQPLGRVGTAAGIAIAFLKAGLVAALFMQLSRAGPLLRLAAAAGCLFAVVMFALTFADVLSRP